MNHSHIKKKTIKDFGKRPLTEEDFFLECEKRGFWVSEMPLEYDGMTWWVRGITSITINSELAGVRRLRAMWHEFAHAILHAPRSHAGVRFSGMKCPYSERQEQEAEDFVDEATFYGF